VELPPGTALADQEWLAVAVADRTPGADHGRVRLAAAADRELALRAAPALVAEADEVTWVRGDPAGVVARHVRRLGAIVLAEHRDGSLGGLRTVDLGLLRWSGGARRLRDRLAPLHRVRGPPWPDVSDEALLADPERWGPHLAGARNRSDLGRVDAAAVLRGLL